MQLFRVSQGMSNHFSTPCSNRIHGCTFFYYSSKYLFVSFLLSNLSFPCECFNKSLLDIKMYLSCPKQFKVFTKHKLYIYIIKFKRRFEIEFVCDSNIFKKCMLTDPPPSCFSQTPIRYDKGTYNIYFREY